MYAVWNLDVFLGSIGNERLDIGYGIWVIGDRGLDIEDTIGNLVGHCFIVPMHAVVVHRVAYYHHLGWGDPFYLPLCRGSIPSPRREGWGGVQAHQLWLDILVIAARGDPKTVVWVFAYTMGVNADWYLFDLSEVC